ncbi:MAG: tetratricopeptide repeat protein [Anaerolineae bacterium]|nr:tetratricopeptide repeat protein [Anaerolineae bacterium]
MQERQFKDQVDAHEKAGDTDAAIETCTRWIEYNPDSVHAYAMRGNLKVKKNDEDGAIADYTEVIRLDPRSYNAHYVRGCHYLKKRQLDAAIADFDAAIKRDPKDRGAYYSRSVAHLYNTQFTRTLEDTTIAIRLDNKDYCAFLYRGLARGELGDLDGAEEDFRQMLALHPESETTASINLGWIEGLRGNYDKALELLNKAEQLEPEYEAIYWTRGKVYALKEDRALAVSDYKRALALRHGIETKWSLRFLHEMEAYIEQWGSSAE